MEIFRPKQETGPETRRSPDRSGEGDRRRGTWRDFRRAYPGFVFVLGLALFAMIAVDGWLLAKRVKYNQDVKSLRDHMSQAERERSDAIVQSEQNKLRIAIELAKRQAKFDKKLHLNVSIDSSRMYLTREGAVLREMPVQFGPERTPSESSDSPPAAIPRGERTVADLSETKITLDGGTQILSSESAQVSNDSTAIPPGSLRISIVDMKAIKPNLNAGMKVYFY
jgi:type III secretory pathway component EscV